MSKPGLNQDYTRTTHWANPVLLDLNWDLWLLLDRNNEGGVESTNTAPAVKSTEVRAKHIQHKMYLRKFKVPTVCTF